MSARKTYCYDFVYTDEVMNRKPVRKPGEDLRDLPTYTIPETATLLAASPRTVQSWYGEDSRILTASGNVGDIQLLSFRDLTETYILQILRSHYDLSMQSLRRIMENAKKETGKNRPLLEADLKILFGKLILTKPRRGQRPRHMVDLGSPGRQLAIPELVDLIGTRISKDPKGAPAAIYPWRLLTTEDQSRPVSMDPEVLSGRLVVTGTRIPVRALLGMRLSKVPEEEIARIYDLSLDVVKRALLHIERPIHKKAA